MRKIYFSRDTRTDSLWCYLDHDTVCNDTKFNADIGRNYSALACITREKGRTNCPTYTSAYKYPIFTYYNQQLFLFRVYCILCVNETYILIFFPWQNHKLQP